jgi:hypothetical protein
MQILGVDYTDSYAVMALDQSILTVLAVSLHKAKKREGDVGDHEWKMAQVLMWKPLSLT